jgi:hypothetical protein
VEGSARLAPHLEYQSDGFLHLADARRRPWRKLSAILLVFALEPAGADTERHAAAADMVNAGGDLSEMRWIAVGNRRGESGQARATCTTTGNCRWTRCTAFLLVRLTLNSYTRTTGDARWSRKQVQLHG